MDMNQELSCCRSHAPARGACIELAILNGREACRRVAPEDPCRKCRIYPVLSFIDSSPVGAISVESVASYMQVSTSRLRHLFKQFVGVSFHQYIMALRMERARFLLQTTRFTIGEIAMILCIRDQSHFLRDFKRTFGECPGSYRTSIEISARLKLVKHGALDNTCHLGPSPAVTTSATQE